MVTWCQDGKAAGHVSEEAKVGEYGGGTNVAAHLYKGDENMPPLFGPAGKDVGVLKGTWEQMGRQLAERTGPCIRDWFDMTFQVLVNSLGTVERVVEATRNYEVEIAKFSPQAVRFMKGIAEGSQEYFKTSRFADACSDYEKIVFLNSEYCMKFGYPGEMIQSAGDHPGTGKAGEEACSGIAVLPAATNDGTTIFGHNCDPFSFAEYAYGMTFIAIPDEPGAIPFWTSTTPGKINALMAVNSCGVAQVIMAGPARTWVPEEGIRERSFGVPWPIIQFMQAAYATNMQEAVELLTKGTPEYRALTGRATLLRARQNSWLIADRHDACVVEATAYRYAIRRPGDRGEKDYICSANHFVCDYSFDENGVRTSSPMTLYGNEDTHELSTPRWYTLYWLAKQHHGDIDAGKVCEWLGSHFYITKTGDRVDQVWNAEYKAYVPARSAGKTVCCHSVGYPEAYKGGTAESKVAILDENLVYWSFGRPCEYEGLPRAFSLPPKAAQ